MFKRIGSRGLQFAAGIAVSAACLWLAFRKASLHDIWAAASALPAQIILLCLGFGSITLFLRAVRWRILLEAAEPVSLSVAFTVNSAGQMGNSILPARLGDVFRATNLKRAGLSTGFALATVVAERILDAGFLVLLSSLALTVFPGLPTWLAHAARWLAVAAALGLAVTLLLPRLENLILSVLRAWLPESLQEKISPMVAQFLSGLRGFHDLQRAGMFLFWTAVIWILDATGVAILAHGLSIPLRPVEAALFLTAIALSSVIPAAPGNLGVFQYVALSVLTSFGAGQAQALSLALILQAITGLTLCLWGSASLWFLSARGRQPKPAVQPSPVPVPQPHAIP